jgi:hypothetical protein
VERNINTEGNIIIYCGNKHITNTSSTKFLGLHIDETLSWTNHIDQLIINCTRLVMQLGL